MRKRIVTGLTWRAGVAIAATALAAGTGATAFHLVNDTEAGDGTTIENHATTTTTEDTTTTTVDDHGADLKANANADDKADKDADENEAGDDAQGDEHEHPDNFGAVVSEDAHDGGVDGQEISEMAHERNDARQADNENDKVDASADHRQDGEHENSGDGNDD